MKVKTNTLTGKALDYAVAIALGATNFRYDTVSCYWIELDGKDRVFSTAWSESQNFAPSSDWRQGGEIIEKAGISVSLRYGSLSPNHVQDVWDAVIKPEFYSTGRRNSGVKKETIATGPLPLVAAMRCYVASKLGEEVEIPEGLS